MSLVHEVGTVKNETQSRVYVPEREARIFKNLSANSTLSPKEIQNLYTEIISSCRRLENIFSVALLKDSTGTLALKKIFGEYINPMYFSTFEKFITIESDIKYLLTPFSKEMIEALKNNNWFIINSIYLDHQEYFLLSKFKNQISSEDESSYFLSNISLDNQSLKLKEDLYFSIIKGSFKDEEKYNKFINNYPNSQIQLVGDTIEI